MSKETLSDDQQRFIGEVAALLTPWGMPLTAARLYGCLLLHADPLTLDQIAGALQVSKSSASVAARLLEKYNMARRQGAPGSKRVYYSLPENYAGLLAEQGAILGKMGNLLARRGAQVASGGAVERMAAMSGFYLAMQAVISSAIDDLTAGREHEHFSMVRKP